LKYTGNYNLKKPEGSDVVNIEDLNNNADIIDQALKAHDDVLATKETPAGAQAKANIAEANAKAYTDAHEQKAAPHSGHETPAGAQAKANAALNSAKQYTDQEVGGVSQALAAHQENNASTSKKGHVQLTNSVSSTSTTTAATPNSVKQAYDKANAAETNAKNHANSLVGTLSNLLTTAKNNVVAAINEIFGKVEDYVQHGVTMGSENDIYVAKIGSLFEFTSLEANYGGYILAIALDDEFVYVGGVSTHGVTTQTVKKLRKSDLSQVAESADYGGTIFAIATDDDFVYVGGWTTRTVKKLRKSDLSQVAESASYGGDIRAMAADNEFVYVGGFARTVRVIENRDLIKIIRRYQ